MRSMTRNGGAAAVLVLFALSGCGPSRVATGGAAPALRAAQASLDGGAYDDALAAVSPWVGEQLAPADRARVNYLAGTALFRKADAGIGSLERRGITVNLITREEEEWLHEARRKFDDAFWAEPTGDLAAESLLMAGRVQDIGYLQNFAEALDRYRWASRMFPETAAGRMARERADILESRMEGLGSTAHGR